MANDLEEENACKQIDQEITYLKSNWLKARDQLRTVKIELFDLNKQLAESRSELTSLQIGNLPGRASRGALGPYGVALSIIDAARIATEVRRIQSDINYFTEQIRRLENQQEKFEREQSNREINIKHYQRLFLDHKCNRRGFNSQHLNAPGY